MKRDFLNLLITTIFFIITVLLSFTVINQKKYISKMSGETNFQSNDTSGYFNLLYKSFIINNLYVPNQSLLAKDGDSIRLKNLLSDGEKIIVYLNRNVCIPCFERFLQNFEKFTNDLELKNKIILIIEIDNLRQINILVTKYSSFKNLYFSPDYFLISNLYIDKPCLFILNEELIIRNTLIYDDYLNNALYEWLRINK
jgi:hypothetical protein